MDKGSELYQSFLDGNEKALDELIAIFRTSLTNFIYGFVKDSDTAEDIMIDAFVELIRRKSFKGKSTLKTYLFAIARNKALRYLKGNKHDFVSLDEAENYISAEDFTENYLAENERREKLNEALESLNPTYREVIYLIYYENMSYKEAAEILHKNQKQIANIACRAMKSLREYFKEREKYNEQNQ